MANISKTIPVNISKNPNGYKNIFIVAECAPEETKIYSDLFKFFRDVFTWYYDKMLGIDPRIV